MSFIPLPFYEVQMITPFLYSSTLANHDKVEGLLANGEILIKGIISIFQNLFSSLNLSLIKISV
jgi:hypothetical protein